MTLQTTFFSRLATRATCAFVALSSLIPLVDCTGAEPSKRFAGVTLPSAYQKPDIWLTDTEGRRFNFRAETAGQLTLVEFGYTHCPDVCPVTMANIAAALTKQPYEFAARVRVYFVTLDPARDTPVVLRTWLNAFNPTFVGIVGSSRAVDSLTAALHIPRAAFARRSAADTAYSVGHATQVVVFTPDNLAHVIYPFGVRQEDWARDLPKLAAVRRWEP